jgi:hypothetical protein
MIRIRGLYVKQFSSFPEKNQKEEEGFLDPKFGEADSGGLGACPQQNFTYVKLLSSFPEKKQKR